MPASQPDSSLEYCRVVRLHPEPLRPANRRSPSFLPVAQLNATSLVVAEQQDKGALSDAEAKQQLADAKSAAISELLRRRADGAQTEAQMASAQTARSQAMTAAQSAPNPFAVPAPNPCAVLVGGRCR